MTKSKLHLPPLVFGQNRSQVDLDLLQMQSRVSSITNWVSEYDTLDWQSKFLHRTSVYSANGVRLIAVASSPTVMKVNDPECTIALPLQGSLEAWVGKKHLVPTSDKQAIYFPSGKRHAEGGVKSNLLVSVSEKRLLETARIMLGERYLEHLDIRTPRLIDTQIQQVDFRKVLRQICNLIDQFQGDQTLLRSFNVDENIARLLVMMLAPKQFMNLAPVKTTSERTQVLKHICDFMECNLDQPLSLTTLATVSGLSTRVLQNEFQKNFACSPTQWIKQLRLSRAHMLFNKTAFNASVTSVAASCGYTNFSEFSRQYQEMFGELPSQTIKNTKNF